MTVDIKDLEKKFNSSVFMKHFGAKIILPDENSVRAEISPLEKHHRGGLGTEAVNGVVLAGLFDLVIGTVGVLHTVGKRAGTAQLSMTFMRPVLGDKVIAEARLIRKGGNMIFCQAEILDEQGKVCARCDGIVGVAHTNRQP